MPALLMAALSSCKAEVVEVTVSPGSATVAPGESVQLQASVTGTSDKRVQWTVTSGGGTVDAEGLYTAPAQEGFALVRATSAVSPESFAHAQVTVRAGPPVPGITLLPSSQTLGVQQSTRFEAQISHGTGTEQLEWRVEEGASGGTVSTTEERAVRYRAPATQGTFHLSVSIQGKPEISARATVTVTLEPPRATLRGHVSYAGQKKGRVYVMYMRQSGGEGSMEPFLSTSLLLPGDYSLTPLPVTPVPEFVRAFLDTHGTGRLNVATDPQALVPLHLTGEDQVVDLVLTDPSQPPALAAVRGSPQAVGSSDALLVAFNSSYDFAQPLGELADAYRIYWGTQEKPGPSNALGSRTVSSGHSLLEYGHLEVVSGLAPGQYYVSVASMRGGVESSVVGSFPPVEVGRVPAAGATLSGKVQLEAPAASGWVYVMVAGSGRKLLTRVAATSSTISWSIPGVPEGSYGVWALLDADGDGFPERSTPRVADRPRVTVSGTAPVSAPDLSFGAAPPTVRLSSLQQTPFSWAGGIRPGGIFYNFNFFPGSKQLVAVRLTGGQGLPTPYDVPGTISSAFSSVLEGAPMRSFWFEWYADTEAKTLPATARYTAEVHNDDGSTELLPVDVPRVLPLVPLTAPVGSASTSSTPTFVWTLPLGLPGSVTLRLTIRETNPFGQAMWSRLVPLSQTQLTYNDDGQATALSPGQTYFWDMELNDGQDNVSRSGEFFQVK